MLIGEYRLIFFPREDFICPCGETLSKQDIIFYITAKDSTTTGI